jgi:hypothetical protein
MLRGVLVGTVVAAAAICVASPATADAGKYPGNDAGFFSYLESNGYAADTDELQDDLRAVAAAVCHLFDLGAPESQAAGDGTGLSARESHVMNVGAVNFYCPWNRPALNS